MKFLFLDVDGVLNSVDWWKRRPSREEWSASMGISLEEFGSNRLDWALRNIDPDAVAQLNRIVAETGAIVVVSSTWRTMYPLHKLEWLLRRRGFEHHLIGSTPCKWDMPASESLIVTALVRGDEIAAWLALFGGLVSPEQIAILDDDSDMGPFMDRLVKTDHDVGLTRERADRAIELLGRKPESRSDVDILGLFESARGELKKRGVVVDAAAFHAHEQREIDVDHAAIVRDTQAALVGVDIV